MFNKLSVRGRGESGFTLVELLVVMLILGLLAAIAIPSFFNQRDKARDADAKSAARTAQTAAETYATDNQGSYAGVDFGKLQTIEQTLSDAPNVAEATAATRDADKGYVITVTSDTANVFTITRFGADQTDGTKAGQTKLTCVTATVAGCPTSGEWG